MPLDAASTALADVGEFDHAAIEAALRAALVEGLGLKPRLAFAPVRVAITGRRISPPLFESIALLGRDSALARIAAARRGAGRLSRCRSPSGHVRRIGRRRPRRYAGRPSAPDHSAGAACRPSRPVADAGGAAA